MSRNSNVSSMPCTYLTQLSSTFNKCLRVLHSATEKKASKIVVGDQSGTLTCFKWLKELSITFQQRKESSITALTLDGDKIVIGYGQTIEIIKKKGKILSKYNLSLNENITSLQSSTDLSTNIHTLWCCGEYLFNSFQNKKDFHFFMSSDIINDIILIDLGFDELSPILGCKDKSIRILNKSELLFQIETSSNVLSLHQILINNDNNNKYKQFIYGLENGDVGQILLNQNETIKGWILNDNNNGSVNCITSYNFTDNQYPELIVGRDNGIIHIYQSKSNQKPFILTKLQLNESITAIDTGYITGITQRDIVIVTYSGKVIAFHCDPMRDFSGWELQSDTNNFSLLSTNKLSLKSKLKKSQYNELFFETNQDIEDYQREIAYKKTKYQERSKELIAVNTQFNLRESLKLIESEASYLLTLEIGIPIDMVTIQSCIRIVSLNIDKNFGLQTQHKINNLNDNNNDNNHKIITTEDNHSNNCFVFHSCSDNITRFIWKFRVLNEGEQGILTAFVSSARIPKTAQSINYSIQALSLHSSIYKIEDSILSDLPLNTLEINGDWTVTVFNSWLIQCIPDMSSRINDNQIELFWQSKFIGDYITVYFTNNKAIFKSDSVTSIKIIQEFLTKIAIKNNIAISNVNISIDINSCMHFFNLIRPKLEYHYQIHQKHLYLDALKEIESHEDNLLCLSDKMQNILKERDQIISEFKTSPKHLEFIKNMIWNNIHNFAKLRNVSLTDKHLEQLKTGLHNTDCDEIISVIKDIMR